MIDLTRLMFDDGASRPAIADKHTQGRPDINGVLDYLGDIWMYGKLWHVYAIKELYEEIKISGWWLSGAGIERFRRNPQVFADRRRGWSANASRLPGWGHNNPVRPEDVRAPHTYCLYFLEV